MANDSDNRGDRGRWPGFDMGGSPEGGGRSRWRYLLIYVLIGVFLLFLFRSSFEPQVATVPLNTFFNELEADRISEVVISTDSIEWQVKGGELKRATLPINFETNQLIQDLSEKGVDTTAKQPSAWTAILVNVLPLLVLFIVLYWFVWRRMAGGGAAGALNLGRKGVKIYDRKDMKTTFADVAGLDEPVEELKEIVEFLRNPKKYQRLGGRIPKGVLLLGPPGCGKTLLARAVAGEAQVPFFFMSGSEFVEMFVGLGAARVRELFNQAKEKAPCLVFLDELDTIGKSRAGALGGSLGSHDEREQTLNQLLVEMDGFDTSKGVIIMAATNRGDVLDPALLRPGRFDRQVVVDRPDLRGRDAILKVHARGVALDPSVDLRVIASRTPGFTGADLANAINEAALLAARREKNSVTMEELEEAIDRVVAGLERKSRVLSEKEKARVATHEMGHALVGLRLQHIDPVHRVTIIPRGFGALGITMTRPLEDRYILTEPELLDRLAFALGGRTAEEIMFKEISTGAADDLQKATEIARAMVIEYGMSPRLGPLSFAQDGLRRAGGGYLFPGDRPEMSEETARVVDEEAARLMNEAHERARVILTKDRRLLDRLSKVLIEREVIDGEELRSYLDGELAIPSDDELKRESEQKTVDNGHKADSKVKPGPAIRPSITPESDPAVPTQEIPIRPDRG